MPLSDEMDAVQTGVQRVCAFPCSFHILHDWCIVECEMNAEYTPPCTTVAPLNVTYMILEEGLSIRLNCLCLSQNSHKLIKWNQLWTQTNPTRFMIIRDFKLLTWCEIWNKHRKYQSLFFCHLLNRRYCQATYTRLGDFHDNCRFHSSDIVSNMGLICTISGMVFDDIFIPVFVNTYMSRSSNEHILIGFILYQFAHFVPWYIFRIHKKPPGRHEFLIWTITITSFIIET